ncbi:multidrug ABC transporter permease [Amycolatopsis antarctica]|uniref:Transport permease protein n=1 Tax=Amycolatopsis antarctica TaxID=1854586 RepID=A0A263D795_9PSEU|nr:multidrug ABC transporter permease [Amycolatopsis antarctica]
MRWAFADGWTVTRRFLIHLVRQPAQVAVLVAFPILMVLMFGYLVGGAIGVPGGGDYIEFLMPGMFTMTMLFGVSSTMLAVRTDAANGVTDRFRSMPMSPSAVLVGRCAADMFGSTLALASITVCGLIAGWQSRAGIGATLLAFALLLLLRFALLWIGIHLGLMLRSNGAISAVQTLEFPIGFLSAIFVAPSTMPGWLGVAAEWNPLSATATAARELFGNAGWGSDSWIASNSVLMAIVWPLLIVAVFFPLAVRRYRGLGR